MLVQLGDFIGEIPREIKHNRKIPRTALFIALGVAVMAMGAAIVSTAKKI